MGNHLPLGTAVGLQRILIVLLMALYYKGKIKTQAIARLFPIKRKKGGLDSIFAIPLL